MLPSREILPLVEFKQKVQYNQATPAMQQYFDIKAAHQDCLVLFRMGDFYELFFEDAAIVSKALNLALAKRGRLSGSDILMCGVPFHALEPYLNKLIELDYKVAVCEQMESPEEAKKRGYKAVVKREVIRIITPGTVTEEGLVNAGKPNYLISLVIDGIKAAISYVDVATAEIAVVEVKLEDLGAYIALLNPKEVLLSEKLQEREVLGPILQPYKGKLVYQIDSYFAAQKSIKIIEGFYNLKSIAGIGSLSAIQIGALGATLEYISITQKHNMPKLRLPLIINVEDVMTIDAATRKNLELTHTTNGHYKGSLLSVIDCTLTKGGSRLLHKYIAMPLTKRSKIVERLELTAFFHQSKDLTNKVRALLKHTGDLDRLLTRVSMKKATPRDLLHIESGLIYSEHIKEVLAEARSAESSTSLHNILLQLADFSDLRHLIKKAIKEDTSAQLSDGGFIKLDYHPRVAELYDLLENSRVFINNLKNKYQKITGLDNIKINHNNLIGLFIEVTSRQANKVVDSQFIHRQTTVNSVRFVTAELQELEAKMVNARSMVISLEREIFQQICDQILKQADGLRLLATALNILDVFSSLGHLAAQRGYVRPMITEGQELIIEGGRHPVVEESLKVYHSSFIANDCRLADDQRIWLITGPNMAGKSTFLRQNALIVLLAQIGAFVPASYAKIGIADKIFSRIGSGDDLAAGQSTFMVEMLETSAILAQATDKSLIILDEVGRGTAVYDGLSIAWSILEYIHDQLRCRSLFATHYHELTQLTSSLKAMRNYFCAFEDKNDEIFFSHKVLAGALRKSYGVQVAALAGLPDTVIARAKALLSSFESSEADNQRVESIQNTAPPHKIINFIKELSIDDLSPKQALDRLYQIKNMADDS